MQNFDPQALTDRVAALELKFELLRNRINVSDGHASEAGVGATQIEGVEIPAKEIGKYEGAPHGDAEAAEIPVFPKPSPLEAFLAKKGG